MTYTNAVARARSAAAVESISYQPVQAFCREHQCQSELNDVVRIAAECFDAATINLSPRADPETREDWIEIAVDARGSVQDLMNAEHRFTLRLRKEVSSQMRDHVRLYLTSVAD